ncbi:DUF2330 domain-containing protein [Candidatus Riflebacteria bacterium]
MNKFKLVFAVILLIYPGMLTADRGSIPFDPEAKVFEPNQRAMIAWNGAEEILLLSTDLKASKKTEVLEVLPLPSEPVVKKGDVEVFRKMTELINRKLRQRMSRGRSKKKGEDLSESRAQPPAGEVTFQKKIGAHDISVTHVLNTKGFVKWVEDYLILKGVKNPKIPGPMKGVVEEYLAEGFTWFVFDVVSLDETLKTNDAIQYRFATNYLFYPMKISKTEEGFTTVKLLVLTPKLLSEFPGIPVEKVRLPHEPVNISSEELRGMNVEMDELLGSRNVLKLRHWMLRGYLYSFDKDLIAK